jgi:hypothetical protein
MVQPYQINIPNVGKSFLSGMGAGQELVARNRELEQRRNAQERQNQMQEAFANLANKEDKTIEDYQQLMTQYPEMGKQIQQSIKMLNDQQKKEKAGQLTPIHVALMGGNTDAAKAKIDELIDAHRNRGLEAEASNLEILRQNIDIDPKGALTSSGFLLAAIDPEKFKTITESQKMIGEEKRAKELQPGEIKKQQAELIKFGLKNDLTRQEALKTAAETKKLGIETQKIIMEMEGLNKGGNLSADKKVDLEQKLADKYYSRNKDYLNRVGAYHNLLESAKQDTGPGDYALIVAFNKMLDPNSVVRESEFALAEASAGRMQQLLNFFKKFKEGDRLKPGQRQQFVRLAKKYMDESENNQRIVTEQLDKTVDAYGLNRELVIPREREIESAEIQKGTEVEPLVRQQQPQAETKPIVMNSIAEAEKASFTMEEGTRIQVGNKIFKVKK